MELAREDMAGPRLGGGNELSLLREPKAGCVDRAERAREALGKMKLDKGRRPGRGGPCQLWAKGSHLRVSSREGTWANLFLKVWMLWWTEGKRWHETRVFCGQSEIRGQSPLPVHLPRTTSSWGWYPSETDYRISLAARLFFYSACLRLAQAKAEGQDVVSAGGNRQPFLPWPRTRPVTAQLVTVDRFVLDPQAAPTVMTACNSGGAENPLLRPLAQSPTPPLLKHSHKLLAPGLKFAQQKTNSHFQTIRFPLLFLVWLEAKNPTG